MRQRHDSVAVRGARPEHFACSVSLAEPQREAFGPWVALQMIDEAPQVLPDGTQVLAGSALTLSAPQRAAL